MLFVSHRCIQISTCNRSHSQQHIKCPPDHVAVAALSRSLHWHSVIIEEQLFYQLSLHRFSGIELDHDQVVRLCRSKAIQMFSDNENLH